MGQISPRLLHAIEELESLIDYYMNTEQYKQADFVRAAYTKLLYLKHNEVIAK